MLKDSLLTFSVCIGKNWVFFPAFLLIFLEEQIDPSGFDVMTYMYRYSLCCTSLCVLMVTYLDIKYTIVSHN
jgi:hypothetical protein